MKVAVVGTGYVGLVTATCLAESGNDVAGIDNDARKVATLESGALPIYEPGLLELVQRNSREGRLRFSTDLGKGIAAARMVFIAVGTPQAPDGAADLTNLWSVADAIADHLTGPKIIVVKSTVPVGTNRALLERMRARTKQSTISCGPTASLWVSAVRKPRMHCTSCMPRSCVPSGPSSSCRRKAPK